MEGKVRGPMAETAPKAQHDASTERSDMEKYEDLEIVRGEVGLTRREFLIASTAAAAVAILPRGYAASPSSAAATPPSLMQVTFNVNGQPRTLELDPRTTLLDALREHLHLTGSKKGCDHGQCGACTVLVGGRRVNSCLTLAVMQQGAEVTTIEGLGTPEKMHPLQTAFVKCDGYQCGYCTSGQICSAVAMVEEIKAGIPSHATAELTAAPPWTSEEIRERMSGNLCRCGAYSNIHEAIEQFAGRRP
jgi:xanthine dehydrogenase YagT iron-sulfur-binding subunit